MSTLWKSANITPIHKGDSRELVTNYRSISLLPISAKYLERIVRSAIYDYISPFLTELRHGFVKGRSCETQLILTQHQWATAFDEDRQVDVVFLDFSKAFDKVNHSVLMQKLGNFGITGSLLQWCESFSRNRRQRVVLDVYSLPGLMSHLESLRALYWGLYFLLYLLVTFVKLFFLAVLLPFMQMTANVPEALTRFAILTCFNKTWIICIRGVLGIS